MPEVCVSVCVIEREREAGSRGMTLAQGCAGTVVWLRGSAEAVGGMIKKQESFGFE
jgi:hypothetical protein